MRKDAILPAALLVAFLVSSPALAHPSGESAAEASSNGHQHDHGNEAPPSEKIEHGDLVISGYWTRATLPNQRVGAGYMTIVNEGDNDDRLVAITSPVTERGEIHEMALDNDVMTMRRLDDGLAVPAGGSVSLEPGGYHLMFQDLEEAFTEGEHVSVTLSFERAGNVTIDLPVHPAGSRQGHGGHHGHDGAHRHQH